MNIEMVSTMQDLRNRILSGEDVEAEEMLLIIEDLRKDRRSAEGSGKKKKTQTVAADISLNTLFNFPE